MLKLPFSKLLLLVLVCGSMFASGSTVSNRPPDTDDIGYLPADGETVGVNPPALVWLPEPGATAYMVQFSRDTHFERGVITVEKTSYSLYTHTSSLEPGLWFWRYAFLDGTGKRSTFSKVRSFRVPNDAPEFPRPDEEMILREMPRQHPRLMLRPEELETFREARTGAHKERWEKLVAQAEEYLKAELIPEPPPWTNGEWNAEEWRRNYLQAVRASEIAETLAFCYMLSGDR